jgi:hypothetical protein
MIWIIISATLYLLIAAAGLFLICSQENGEARKDAYYDIRNISVALFWPLPVVWFLIRGLATAILNKGKKQAEEPGADNV